MHLTAQEEACAGTSLAAFSFGAAPVLSFMCMYVFCDALKEFLYQSMNQVAAYVLQCESNRNCTACAMLFVNAFVLQSSNK